MDGFLFVYSYGLMGILRDNDNFVSSGCIGSLAKLHPPSQAKEVSLHVTSQ